MRAVVIGGGWAGALALRELACGMRVDVVIVESAERPGGLLRSESANGFTFDTGGSHVLFSRNEAELRELLGLLGDNLVAHERRSFARLRGHTVPYPVENGISELPAELRAELGAGLAGALANPPPDGWRPSSFLEWIERTFGEPLARDYMIPYNRKIWKRPLEDMDAGWVHIPGRLPHPQPGGRVQGGRRNPHGRLRGAVPLPLPQARRHPGAVRRGAGRGREVRGQSAGRGGGAHHREEGRPLVRQREGGGRNPR